MISELYQKVLENELGRARYLLLLMMVGTLQIVKQAKLEILAEALPIPILFESRRKKLKRFLKLEVLNIEKIWFLCLKEMLKQEERFTIKGLVYIAIDRTSWGAINILMVSIVYDKRAIPIYWEILKKKGSSNLKEQQQVLEKVFELLSDYKIVVLGDREFCSVSLGKWLEEKGVYFCLRQKQSTNVKAKEGVYQEMRELGLSPGTKLFLNDVNITKDKGFGGFNLACKWKKTYRGFKTKEPWYILTNFGDLETAIIAYQKRFDIEEMFRDLKSGGYNLEGSQLAPQHLSKLIIVIAIAYTSATVQGKKIKDMGIQKYITRPEKRYKGQRRHSSFYVGQHLYYWLHLHQMFQKSIEELMQISSYRLKDYIKGQRAMELALSTF
ncbi:MAG: IS4 family transposase [Dolichospermum sp. DEX182a]|nr:IS4 family transposase [Dolichospermum sp. DEX182a]MBO1048845.1 IS4 family transposase [Dolichospermum sp. DEX182a]MBO1049769.1 IS4 family transposase [Dolichospermum sp. DEX182a]MBO1049908.1 IS4 family transposase [Dolichospermum sp. DEX182a]MBO1050007.1 IS4 family transposase [Dolichospermum sp. DEX182a]